MTNLDFDSLTVLAHTVLQQAPQPAQGLATAPVPEGVQATHCPQVFLFHQTCAQAHQPALYEPGLILVLSGHKRISLGAQTFAYDRTQGLLLTAAYPVLCTASASAESPLLGLYIALERPQVAQLLEQIQRLQGASSSPPLENRPATASAVQARAASPAMQPDPAHSVSDTQVGITPLAVTHAVLQAVAHLLAVLADPIAAALFGPERSQALLYTLMAQVPLKKAVQRWLANDGSYAQFLKAIGYIQSHLVSPLTVQDIAAQAGLSESSLNRAFKRFAEDTPLQYVKKLRLNHAHTQLMRSHGSVQTAAYDAGYESVSQFSRDFKRYFGVNPKETRKKFTCNTTVP